MVTLERRLAVETDQFLNREISQGAPHMTMYVVLTMGSLATFINVTKNSSLLEKKKNKHTITSHINQHRTNKDGTNDRV